jgi:hypothetical protein
MHFNLNHIAKYYPVMSGPLGSCADRRESAMFIIVSSGWTALENCRV